MHYLVLTAINDALQEKQLLEEQEVVGMVEMINRNGQDSFESWIVNAYLKRYHELQRNFTYRVYKKTKCIMEQYYKNTKNPKYREFCDVAEDMEYTCNKVWSSDEDYVRDCFGFPYYKEESGRYGFYHNPNGLWDYYSVGGAWQELFLVKENCAACVTGKQDGFYDEYRPETPKGYKWVCAARKKDIAWDALGEWTLRKLKYTFTGLEKLFVTGERNWGIDGTVTEDGIYSFGELVYRRGESEESYLKRKGVLANVPYSIVAHGFLDERGYTTKNSFYISALGDKAGDRKEWPAALYDYVDHLGDDDILVGVDCQVYNLA